MYRASRWTTAASKAIRDSSRTADRQLLKKDFELHRTSKRNNLTAAGKGGFQLLKFAISGVAAVGVTIGSAIFYAGRNDKIRDDFENKMPFVKPVLSSIYGERQTLSEEAGGSDDDLGSLLPMKKNVDVEDETTETSSGLFSDVQEEVNADERITEEIEELTVEKPVRDNVVVITTIDDQAAVSSVDLDISNANSTKEIKTKIKKKKKEPKEKETKKKKKDESQESQKEEQTAEQPTAEPPAENSKEELVAITASGLAAVDILADDGSSKKDVAESIPAPPLEASALEEVIPEKELTIDEIGRVSELVDQTTMEVLLQTYIEKLQLMQENAIQKHNAAAEKLQEYTTQLGKALAVEENGEAFDTEWKTTSDLEHTSQELMDIAKDSELKMQSNIEAIYEMIKAVRKAGPSDVADSAQEAVTKASLELIKATEDIRQSSEDLVKMSKQYIISEDSLKEEVQPLFDDVVAEVAQEERIGDSQLPFKNVLLTYAMKKVDFLKQEMETMKAEEKKKLEEALEIERQHGERRTEVQLQAQEDSMKREFDVLLQKKEADLLEEFENEIRKQLKRQSAAHREHLTDMLQVQAEKLVNEHREKMDGELNKQRIIHGDEMAKIVSHLRGVESMIESVVDVEKKNRKSRELWLAVQSLGSVLNEEIHSGRTKDLLPEISAIAKLAENNETVQFVLGTIPEAAAANGVSTEEGLRKRFADVKSICKRVAMVGDNGSLWTYVLSTLRSFLVFETHAKRDTSSDVDIETITPYEILAKAQSCIDCGDLELAVKFMSLLKGLPRKLASDWLRESRVYLETKQALDFLLAYVASENVNDFRD